MASLCLFWCVWWERNKRIFDGEELNIYKLAKNPYEVSFEIVWKPVGEGMCFSVGFLLIIRTTDSGFFLFLSLVLILFLFLFLFLGCCCHHLGGLACILLAYIDDWCFLIYLFVCQQKKSIKINWMLILVRFHFTYFKNEVVRRGVFPLARAWCVCWSDTLKYIDGMGKK